MEKEVLSNLGGVGIYGIVSVCLFFAFFAAVTIWALGLKKNYLKSMSDLPLDAGERGESPDAKTEISNQK